jgi:hypothetical protein
MNSKYHTRRGYERLYLSLLNERKTLNKYDFNYLSDYQLLRLINRELTFQNCLNLTEQELEMELH